MIIPNGLAREARNQPKVGAYGDSARYQENAYVSMQKTRGCICANLGGTAEAKAFVPFRDESFFYSVRISSVVSLLIKLNCKDCPRFFTLSNT